MKDIIEVKCKLCNKEFEYDIQHKNVKAFYVKNAVLIQKCAKFPIFVEMSTKNLYTDVPIEKIENVILFHNDCWKKMTYDGY